MRHQDGGPRMLIMGVELLHHNHLGPKLFQNAYYTIVQICDALCHVNWRTAFGTADDAGLTDNRLLRADFDDGVAGDL